MAVSPFKDYFIGGVRLIKVREVRGLSSITNIEGIGIVEYLFRDEYKVSRTLKFKVTYIPGANFRLFYPQSYCMQYKEESFNMNYNGSTFTFAVELWIYQRVHTSFCSMHKSYENNI